jgi:hypothetical protein
MEKEFVEYIEALALKDLGFDEPCLAFYNGKFLQSTDYDFDEGISRDIGLCCKTPTYSQAFRWFREKYDLREQYGVFPHHTIMFNYMFNGGIEEEAELECLKKLIEIVKEKK